MPFHVRCVRIRLPHQSDNESQHRRKTGITSRSFNVCFCHVFQILLISELCVTLFLVIMYAFVECSHFSIIPLEINFSKKDLHPLIVLFICMCCLHHSSTLQDCANQVTWHKNFFWVEILSVKVAVSDFTIPIFLVSELHKKQWDTE